jgi:hypothetical protein
MKYETYDQYVKAAKEYFSKKDLKGVTAEMLTLSEDKFNAFNGVIEFGPGSVHVTNCCHDCKCKDK